MLRRACNMGIEMERPRGPGLVFSTLAVAFLVLLGLIALTARTPPPPTIAEFAPQAVENITDAPTDQSSTSGRSGGLGGDGGIGEPTPVPPVPGVIEVPRVRRCVGDPPRQIEDPQSPPCVPYWTGDNGGATYRGVTRDEIIIALPSDSDTSAPDNAWQAMEAFFNKRFEFYGRKIRLKRYAAAQNGFGGSTNFPAMRANADKVADQVGAFASTSMADRSGAEVEYYDALARRGVISAHGRPVWRGEEEMRRWAPYEWAYFPGGDDAGGDVGDFICAQLFGRPAAYAGGVERGKPRVFGVLTGDEQGYRGKTDAMKRRMAQCGATFAVEQNIGNGSQEAQKNAIIQMQIRGVTSIVAYMHSGVLGADAMSAADTQGYFPEWIVTTFLYWDQDLLGQIVSQSQRVHMFGLRFRNKNLPLDQLPSTWAVIETAPSENPKAGATAYDWEYYRYHDLLILASGIQMAGPHLTPPTFEAGLFKAKFPNPSSGGPPYYQARVGFNGDHTMVDDASYMWWGEGQYSYYAGTNAGAWCQYAHGIRFTQGTWPREEIPIFQGSCY